MQAAGGAERHGHRSLADHFDFAGHMEKATLVAEGWEGFDGNTQLLDPDRDRQLAGIGYRHKHGAPEHPHLARGKAVGMEASHEEFAIAPGHLHVGGVQPDALLIRHGQTPDAEVAPQVAAEALDAQLAEASEFQAVGPRLHEHQARRRVEAMAQQQRRSADQQDGDQRRQDDPAGASGRQAQSARPDRGRRGRGGRRRLVIGAGQNACPMLM